MVNTLATAGKGRNTTRGSTHHGLVGAILGHREQEGLEGEEEEEEVEHMKQEEGEEEEPEEGEEGEGEEPGLLL